jgi:hypothetical protein
MGDLSTRQNLIAHNSTENPKLFKVRSKNKLKEENKMLVCDSCGREVERLFAITDELDGSIWFICEECDTPSTEESEV